MATTAKRIRSPNGSTAIAHLPSDKVLPPRVLSHPVWCKMTYQNGSYKVKVQHGYPTSLQD